VGRFHEELVNARRTGQPLASTEPAVGTVAPDPAATITFQPPSDGVPLVCSRCGAIVDGGRVPLHVDWHRVTNT